MTKKIPQEFLLNNRLDQHMQAFLRPLEISHSIYFLSKFTIRDNFITSNGPMYNFISLLGLPVYAILLSLSDDVIIRIVGENFALKILVHFNYAMYFIFFTSLLGANIYNAECNVKLILHLKDSVKSLKYSDPNIKYLAKVNWLAICLVFLMYLVPEIALCLDGNVLYALIDLFLISLDMSIVYVISIVELLKIIINVWLKEIKVRKERCIENRDEINQTWKEVQDAFFNITEAYQVLQKVVYVPVSQCQRFVLYTYKISFASLCYYNPL